MEFWHLTNELNKKADYVVGSIVLLERRLLKSPEWYWNESFKPNTACVYTAAILHYLCHKLEQIIHYINRSSFF